MSDDNATTVEPKEPDLEEVDQVEIPGELAVLPLRGAIIYPYMVLPIHVARGKSHKLVDEAAVGQRVLAVVAQRDEEDEDPTPDELYSFGTACRILRMMQLPDGNLRVLVQGLKRVRFDEFISTEPFMKARVTALEDEGLDSLRVTALANSAKDLFRQLVHQAPALGEELLTALDAIDDPGRLADFIGGNLVVSTEDRQQVLEAADVGLRLQVVTEQISRELKVAEIQTEIQSKVRDEMGKKSREVLLREQMRAIQEELGDRDARKEELSELDRKITAADMPEEAEAEARHELDRMERMPPGSQEYTVSLTYLDWMVSIPWSVETEDRIEVKAAKEILDRDHYDLEKVKDRILEYLSVLKLKSDLKGPILCLAGPPGVGKTSLGRSIARAMGRKFARMSLGGVRDEAEIRGHRRTYVGAMPGRIIQSLRKVGTRNPVFMLDEVDKLGSDFRGDPSSALLEVLDPEQNDTFEDHYLKVQFDLSRVLFIATANMLDTIPPPLRDRMEIIHLPGYAEDQKVEIAKRHLVPRQIEGHGLMQSDLEVTDGALHGIVNGYTREAGVRNLEREIGSLCRKTARKVVEGEASPFLIEAEDLPDHLGPKRFFSEIAERTATPGVITGLVWTPVGGDIIFIESTRMRGKQGFLITGSLGDVMKESAQAALSWVRANAESLGIDPEEFAKWDLHIHVPAGATPKDGPSAGVAIATSLASLFTGRPIQSTVAMTGEITLRGRVLPVGGVKEKVIGAHRAGIETVILPERNEKDLEEIPETIRDEMTFRFAGDVREVVELALCPECEPAEGSERR